jgi:hypothetical protein
MVEWILMFDLASALPMLGKVKMRGILQVLRRGRSLGPSGSSIERSAAESQYGKPLKFLSTLSTSTSL